MSVTSVTEILTAKTADELVTDQLAVMAAADPPLPVTAWQEGGAARTLIEAECTALADVHATVALLGASAFLGEASGDWLTLRAKSTFDLDRILATYTAGTVTLTCTALAGPETITPGALVITLPDGKTYRSTNAANVVVPMGGTNTIGVRAEASGTDYNVALTGATIVTPAAAGLSVSAAALLAWITTTARNEETDAELVARCRARWATLAVAGCGSEAAYTFNILSATRADGSSAGVTRVGFISPPPGDGTVSVRVAGANGPIPPEDLARVRAWINGDVGLGLPARKPISDAPDIQNAATVDVDLTSTTVEFYSGQNTGPNQAAVAAAIEEFINAFPMGSSTETIVVDEAAIASVMYGAFPQRGVIKNINLFTGDVSIPAGSVAVCNTALIAWS